VAQALFRKELFPPEIVMEVKALACQLPLERKLPLSRLSQDDIAREAVARGIVTSISGITIWRWLSQDAIKPWSHRCWIFPRDPQFASKASRVLDLYQGTWDGKTLEPDDYVICADEKTSIQARRRIAPGTSPAPGKTRRVEFEYERKGALAYMAAWDVRQAKVFGLCESATGIESFHRLVDLVMSQEPYRSARRVFWITDNGSSHRGEKAVQRLAKWYPNAVQVFTPVHASWLNQVEIYFSIVQRKVLTPNDFADLAEVEDRLLRFQTYYERIAKPFEWKFTREDLKRVLEKASLHERQLATA
jgi:transposase